MIEQAFRLVKNCELYNLTFQAKNEKQKFHDLAREFFNKYNLEDANQYYQRHLLGVKLNKDCYLKYQSQIKKNTDSNGLYVFKRNSEIQKSWKNEVCDKIDFGILTKYELWYLPYINFKGEYALWDYKDEVYGYISTDIESINLDEDMIPIKMSEYYEIIEKDKE